MVTSIYQVDAFTNQAFAGNPAGVCFPETQPCAEWMQAIAKEMNLSETAFLMPEGTGYRLRWFTPKVEVALCGHATLASAHILFETGRLSTSEIAQFFTLSGKLLATRNIEGCITLDFPSRPIQPANPPHGLIEALGIKPLTVAKNVDDYLVEIESEADLRSMLPDFLSLAKIPARGVVVTCRSTSPEYDFVSRFFAPAVGVNEDPVTGSSHTCLAPYWAAKLGKQHLNAYQASERGGILRLSLEDSRVLISGQAKTIFQGEVCV